MTIKFDTLWHHITNERKGVITVQECSELKHVFGLLEECQSYLEVGSAEGNSLFVLAQALHDERRVTLVDFGERHTTEQRNHIVKKLYDEGIHVRQVLGNSHSPAVIKEAAGMYDAVLIDAGHSYEDVIADAAAYGWMAKRYIIFHDVQLPEVNKAFEWYVGQIGRAAYKFVNSETFGYGIVRV